MNFRKIIVLIYLLFTFGFFAQSQANYDIQLALNSVDCNNNTVCYDVQLRTNNSTAWNLAGQNYRIYYDGSLGDFSSGSSQLGTAYQDFTLVQDTPPLDASSTNGNLSFDNTLSFLNYSIDLNNTSLGGIIIPADGSWMTTSQLCFEVEASLLQDANTCFEAVWARSGLTDDYATSFVEVSEWVAANNTQMANGVGYNDLESSDGEASCLATSCNTPPATVGSYDIQMELGTVDCDNNTVCYNVQLKSNDGNAWGLAGQNYRLYYDGALGSYLSGTSQLGNTNYGAFMLVEDLQNQNATGAGSLGFEGDLSFLNYTIDLSNTTTGGVTLPMDGSWLTTSQLCFSVDAALLNDPNTCFEAVWGRMGTTDAYATSFVEVSEWVAAENTQMANGVGYNDLESSDGEASCLATSCNTPPATVGSYDIQMELGTVDCDNNTVCYNVQLKSNDGNAWGLAGQNYRLYYDGALGSYLSGTSQLGNTNYGAFMLVEDLQNQNATGAGSLGFEGDLSFLNYTIDLSNTTTGGATLPMDGSWLTTSQLCFSVDAALLNDPNTCFEAVWGRMGTTDAYATSFVEVSEWVAAENTQMANGVGYNDLESSDGEASCLATSCMDAGQYGIQLSLNNLDCQTNTACYDVQLQSTDGNDWGLAGQNYRLYYDASLGSYQSGISLLGNADYGSFTLVEDLQNQVATGTGNLAFENTLSFLNYTIDLENTATGGINLTADGAWITTSQLCFQLAPNVIEDPATCFEAIWARMDTSSAYATSFVEVAEWVSTENTRMADGVIYNDLGDHNACFIGYATVYDTLRTAICAGDIYTFAGMDIGVAGNYNDTLSGAIACDSIVTLALTVHPAPVLTTRDTTICSTESLDLAVLTNSTATVQYFTNLADAEAGNNALTSTAITINGTTKFYVSASATTVPVCTTIDSIQVTEQACGTFDLALQKILAANQPSTFSPGDTVRFMIKVINQGTQAAYNYNVVDYSLNTGLNFIDDGAVNPNWALFGNNPSTFGLPQPLMPGDTTFLPIAFIIDAGVDSMMVTNLAEISSADNDQDTNNPRPTDIDSGFDALPDNDIIGGDNIVDGSNLDEDDHDFAKVLLCTPDVTTLNEEICQGESYTLGTQTLTNSGNFQERFTNGAGCDSIVNLTLAVVNVITEDISVQICQGDSYTLGTQSLTQTGIYNEPFQASNGCDSIVTLNLTVNSVINTNLTASICAGESYTLGSQILTESGTFNETFQAVGGCDSIVVLNLEVTPLPTLTLTQTDVKLCLAQTLNLSTLISNSTGTVTYHNSLADAQNDIPVSNIITGQGPATYYIKATASNGLCTIIEPINVSDAACRFDLALDKKLANTQLSGVKVGDTIYYTINVHNQGDYDAYDIGVVDYIPSTLSFVNSAGWTAINANRATATINYLPAGTSTELSIALRINPGAENSQVTNFAEIFVAADEAGGPARNDDDSTLDDIDNNDGTPINNAIDNPNDEDDHDYETIEVGLFDLALTKDLAPNQAQTVGIGEDIDYRICVTNEGNITAYNVLVTDYIPSGLSLSTNNTNNTNWTIISAREVNQTIQTPISPNQTVCLDITLILNSGNAGDDFENIAEISGQQDEAGNNIKDIDSTPDNEEEEEGEEEDDEGSAIITLPPCPVIQIMPAGADICQGESIQLDASTGVNNILATYSWTPTTGLSDPFSATPMAFPTVSTTYIVAVNTGLGCIEYDTVRVNVFDVPNPAFQATTVCQGTATNFTDNSVTYTTLTGWTWDFGDGVGTSNQQNPSYTYANAGIYQVKLIVVSTNGCRDSITKTVTVNPSAQAFAAAKGDTICVGACVELKAQGGSTFQWSPSATLNHDTCFNPIACPTETTTYVVTVTNDFGCASTDSVTVTVIPGPTIDVTMANVTECGQFDGSITINATGLANNYEYSIDGGLTFSRNNIFNNLPASSYLVVVKGAGCEVPYANNPVIIGDGVAPMITSVPLVNPACDADNGSIRINASGTDLQYSINGGINFSATNEFTDLAGGTYYIAVSANGGNCVSYYPPVTLVKPLAPTFTDVSLVHPSDCDTRDGSVTIIAAGVEAIEYGLDNGIMTIWQSSNNFINLPAGQYEVYIRNAGNTCLTSYALNSIVLEGPISPALTSVEVNQPSDCGTDNASINITATAGNTNLVYSIDGGINWGNAGLFENLQPDVYNVLIRNEGGTCEIAYTENPIRINYPEQATIVEVIAIDPTDCELNDGYIEITAEGGANDLIYSIDAGVTWQESSVFANLSGGIYNVRVANGDQSCATIYPTIILENPVAGTIDGVRVSHNDCEADAGVITIEASSQSVLEYSIDGGGTWQSSNNFINLLNGDYTIAIRNVNDNCLVSYNNNPVTISGTDIFHIDQVVATNPTDCGLNDGRIQITTEGGGGDLSYSIDAGETWQQSGIFSNLAGGIYNIRVANANQSCAEMYPTITLVDPFGGTIDNVIVNDNGCEEGTGVITIEASSQSALEYSIDGGGTWQSSNNFINLLNGDYNVAIRNINDNCLVTYAGNPVTINGIEGENTFRIDQVVTSDPTSCESNDGSISITASGGDLSYSIDGGINFINQSDFDDLPGGIYNVFIKDNTTGCTSAYIFNPINLISPTPPNITTVEVTNPSDCKANDAVITVVADGIGGMQYSLDGSTWSNGNTFINLLPGLYNVWVRYDDESCAIPYNNNPIVVNAPTGPIITECIGTNPTDCGVEDGQLMVLATGGQGILQYSIDDGANWQPSNQFTDLAAGIYRISVANEDGTCLAIHPNCALVAPALPMVNEVLAVSPSDCGVDNGSITILADGQGGLEYSINNGLSWSANSFYHNLPAGDYTILVRNAANNCEVVYGVVTLDAPAAPTVISGMENVSTCTGDFVPASITISENIIHYTILGSGGYLNTNVRGGTLTFDAYLNGVVSNFTVTLYDEEGCSVVEEFAIFQAGAPEADFIVQNPICAESEVTIEFTGTASPGATLFWDLEDAKIVSSSLPSLTAPAAASITVRWNTPGGKTIRLAINDGDCRDRSVQNINVNKLPFADAGADVTICDGECVQLQGQGNGSLYQWSPAIGLSATDIPNPLACPPVTTTYQLLVMGAEGCMVMDEVTVTVAGELAADAGADQSVCDGESVQLQATGGISYEWTPSTGLSNPTIANPTATPKTITTYTVKVTNAAGCIDTDEMVVTVNPTPIIDAGQTAEICMGENTMLSATGGVSYQWSPANGLSATNAPNPIASPTTTTTYTVVGTDINGCSASDQVTVIVGANTLANAGIDQTICIGEHTSLNASGGVSYSWSPTTSLDNATIANPTANPSTTTTYTVTVTNAAGCTSTDEVTIIVNNFIAINAGGDQTICQGMAALLNATGGTTYSWSPTVGLSNPTIGNPVATPSVTTTYTVTATTAQGCTATDQVTVTVNNNANINAGGDQTICQGMAALLNATGGTTYSWSPTVGLNNPTIGNPVATPSTTTIYTVTGTTAQGCTATDQVTVTVNNNASINAGANQTICQGGTAFLNATGGVTYNWSPTVGLNNPTIGNPVATPSTTTIYTVTGTTAQGCTATDQVTVTVNNNASINAGANQTICQGGTAFLNATGGVTYNWSPTVGLNNPTIGNPVATPSITTTYTVTATTAQGCTASDQVTVFVENGPTVVGCPDKYICEGGSVRLTVNGGISWVWSPSIGLDNPFSPAPNASPSSTTVYTVTGIDANGCTASDEVIVFVNGNGTANAGADQSTCAGQTVQLNATGGVSYNWSPSFGLSNPNIANPILTPIATTTYTVQVTNADGCRGTDEVTVFVNNSTIVNAGNDARICAGSTTQLNATGGTNYNWSPSAGLSNSSIANPVANPLVTTTYTVTAIGGCGGSDQVTVFVNQPALVVGCEDKTICLGGSTQLTVTTGVSYLYTPSTGLSDPTSPTPIASPTQTTTYTVFVTDANGCTGSDQITVFVNGSATANAGFDQTVCAGGSTQLNASGGTTYSWSPSFGLSNSNIPNPTVTPLATTTYTVTARTAGGCTDTDQVTVFVNNAANVNAGFDQTVCSGSTVQLNATGGTTYSWSPTTSLNNPNIANPIATPTTTTVYTVTSSNGGCVSTDNVTITVGDNGNFSIRKNIVNPGCCNNNGSIILNIDGAIGDLSYNWTPNVSSSNTATNLSEGNYKILITDTKGCQVLHRISLIQNCNDCESIADKSLVCVAAGATKGEFCLPVDLKDIHNYQISADGQIIRPNHGCDFQNLTAYSYALLSGAGNSGPYKIEGWQVNGFTHTGMVNNMIELTNWMNSIDPTGNWTLHSDVLNILGGNPISTYGNLKITHQVTWVETTLNPNTTGVAQSTLVEVPMGNSDNIIVIIRDLLTCCEETVLLKRCLGNKSDCEDFIEPNVAIYKIDDCKEKTSFCIPIANADLGHYVIEQNGSIYTDEITKCETDNNNIQLYAGAGKHIFKFINQLTDCADEIVIKVDCQNTSGLRASRLDFTAFPKQGEVALQWATNTGYKNDYFILEKSTNGIAFETFGRVENEDLGDTAIGYTNRDAHPSFGSNYYRVKQVYIDGTYEYTPTKEVAFNLDTKAISIYPNPAINHLKINLKAVIGKKTTIQIANNFGQVIKTMHIDHVEKELVQIPLNDVINGFYQVIINVEGRRIMNRKLVINRMY